MTVRYVGPGGSDANSGLTWALRKLTLNGVEDTPVVAGDIVHVAPGVYRELLTVDVSGSAGNPVEYISDVSGRNTDGVGGVVRITGSDNDIAAVRANCIGAGSKNYRTFVGFSFDITSNLELALSASCSNWIMQDCYFAGLDANVSNVQIGGTGTSHIFRRCVFAGARSSGLIFTHTSVVDNAGHLVENCLFFAAIVAGVQIVRIGGITVRNCAFLQCVNAGVRVSTALTVGQTIVVNNCIFAWCTTAISATVTGEIIEDYNTIWGSATARSNVAAGANSQVYPPLFNPQLLLAGLLLPNMPLFGLSEWSPLRRIVGSGVAADDLYGITRPATAAKNSWGPLQFADVSREVTTVRTGAASLKLADAGEHHIFVPTTNISTVFSVYVQWEVDYAGTKPQLIIKQPGQTDVVVTATGASGTWELLTTTLTPAASPGYVVAVFRSNNTAAATNFDTFFDDFTAVPA